MKFEWKNDYSVGVTAMDNQHKEIIHLINDLASALESNQNVAAKFNLLADYVVKHFKEEEELMEKNKFAGLGSHKIIHQNLLATVGTFKTEVENGTVEKKKLLSFLQMWLTSHIMGIDKKYGTAFGKIAA